MGHQIIKNLRTEDGKIKCEMCSNNVSPKSYTTWEREDTVETRDMVRGFLRDRVWQPQHANAFIQGLGVYRYFDGTPTPWGVKRTAKAGLRTARAVAACGGNHSGVLWWQERPGR